MRKVQFKLWTCIAFFSNAVFSAPDIQTAEGRGLERARLESERTAIHSKFETLDRECQTRFVVTSCRDDIKLQRTRDLDALTRQESVLNEMDRKVAAAKQQQKLDDKTSANAMTEKEKTRQDALAATAKRAADRAQKKLDKDTQALTGGSVDRDAEKAANKAPLPSEQEKAAKRAAYEEKQQELAKRIKRRDEGLLDLAEKQKAREKEEAVKAEKAAKAEADAAARAALTKP
ncbi:MAG: hypothetical protein RIT15_585 [Pseudomonadota bacterium]